MWDGLEGWPLFLISSGELVEKKLDRKSSKRRKLFNGKIACQYYQYFGPFPPRDYKSPVED